MALKHLKPFQFRKTESSKADKLYLFIMYEGGDADTRHPEFIDLNIKYSEYQEHLEEIEDKIEKYLILKDVLDNPDIKYQEVLKEHGEEIADLFENVPNDPQSDYQFKCYIDRIELIGYDNEGNKYQSYIRK